MPEAPGQARPVLAAAQPADLAASSVLSCRDVTVRYPGRGGAEETTAVDAVSFDLARGETLGLVGETGCGKTSLARAILRLQQLAGGQVLLRGRDLAVLRREELRRARKDIQCVFQDSAGSLNPRHSVGMIIEEGLAAHGWPARDRRPTVAATLRKVGLSEELTRRYPHELSGGQRQRVNIARALAVEPAVLVADEPVSALDVSVQSQILNLFAQLRDELGLTCLFVSHNLAVVAYLSDRVAVMYLGRIVELAPTEALLANPLHPYTRALLAAVPSGGRRHEHVVPAAAGPGSEPSAGRAREPVAGRAGCRYRDRCPIAQQICAQEDPPLVAQADGQHVACHFAGASRTPARQAAPGAPEGGQAGPTPVSAP